MSAGDCGQPKVNAAGVTIHCPRPRAYAVVQEAGALGEYFTIAKSGAPRYCRECATGEAWALNKAIKASRSAVDAQAYRRFRVV